MEMTKTLLTVPKRMLGRMKALAHRRKTTVSHLLREAVEKTYGIDAGLKSELDWKEDPFLKMIGTFGDPIDGGPNDSTLNHDKYIYGVDLKKRGRPK
ncbi:MAG: hypothetical protein COV48_11415 [Elusimicrobia bacterium CG11_big_fil_rev_8_21_14_0_20_64_6]|nr:MAG: hypothetical protein COV48_11415 [Elusimicrobia bacterium CG11_big_fil_rev_8_21_14_0_20_64_6]